MNSIFTVADALASAMKRHGVEFVFGQSIPSAFILALPAVGIRQIGYRTENAGGIMADGYARISHKVGVVAVQNGPAATLLVPPLAEALKASVPIVAIVQDVPRGMVDRHAFQEFDHIALFQGCTKWARRLDRADRLEDYVDMAFTAATSGRPGPVALMLPMDLLREPAEPSRGRSRHLGSFPLDRYSPDPMLIAEAAEIIRRAKSPVVIAGGGVHLSEAAEDLVAFAEAASVPVCTTNMGKGSISEIHELSLGVIGNCMGLGTRGEALGDLFRDADLIVLIGTRTNQNGTDSWTLYPKPSRYIHIDIDPQEVGRNYESLRLIGDVRTTVRALTLELSTKGTVSRKRSFPRPSDAIRAMNAAVEKIGAGQPGAIRPEFLMSVLDRHWRPDDIVVADASYATNWVTTYLTARRHGQRFLTPRGLAGLGWGMPLAMGAKIARPSARVVALVGDGGFGHCWQELETARRMGIAVTVILLNNSILGYQYHAENVHYGHHSDAVRFSPVDHAAIARACGCAAFTVNDPWEFEKILVAALESEVTTLLEIATDPDAYPPLSLFEGHPSARVTTTKVLA